MHLTICYLTSRKNPRIEWFIGSLQNELKNHARFECKLVVVNSQFTKDQKSIFNRGDSTFSDFVLAKPKPNVWSGPHRLTKEDWFAASNARNTGVCYAPDGWIAYVDDLSVLVPGWLNRVREGMKSNKIICGSYAKVKNLKVEDGRIVSFDSIPSGVDSRARFAQSDPWPCDGGWLYGCSCAMPVEALLTINGWPEICDGLGSEDSCCGLALHNAGYQFVYDRKMMTLESEEAHHEEPSPRREDWHFENGKPVLGGNGSDDKSHAALNIALQSNHFPNTFNLRELRQHILSGGEFPIQQTPEHDWFTGMALRDL